MITYGQIRTPRTQAQILAERVQGLQGISPPVQTGPSGNGSGVGTGRLLASGVARSTVSVVVQITASGEPNDGVAMFALSLDGGLSFGSPAAITTTLVAVATTGALVTFVPGLGGADPSFVAGELYSFSVATPVWDSTAWQQFSAPRRLIDLETSAASLQDLSIAEVAGGGYLRDANGPWLDLVAENVYDELRGEAMFAQKYLLLTDAAGIGPITVGPGAFWVRDAANSVRYSNLTSGVVPLNGSLLVLFQAESPGVAYNLGNGGITTLVTPMPGLTVDDDQYVTVPVKSRVGSPTVLATILSTLALDVAIRIEITTSGDLAAGRFRYSLDGGISWQGSGVLLPYDGLYSLGVSGVQMTFPAGAYSAGDIYTAVASLSSLVQAGTETESDDSLRVRCAEKWATLTTSTGAPAQAFQKWAQDASAQVTQAIAQADPLVPGQTLVWLSGAAGEVGGDVVAAVDAALQPHIGLTETCVVASATPQSIPVVGTVYVRAGLLAAAMAAGLVALAEYQAACPIGGYVLGGGVHGVSFDVILACLVRGSQRSPLEGVVDATLSAPAADVPMVIPNAAVFDVTGLVWSEV